MYVYITTPVVASFIALSTTAPLQLAQNDAARLRSPSTHYTSAKTTTLTATSLHTTI